MHLNIQFHPLLHRSVPLISHNFLLVILLHRLFNILCIYSFSRTFSIFTSMCIPYPSGSISSKLMLFSYVLNFSAKICFKSVSSSRIVFVSVLVLGLQYVKNVLPHSLSVLYRHRNLPIIFSRHFNFFLQ